MRALRAILPGALVVLAASAFSLLADEASLLQIAETYGLVLTGAGLALAWVFHRSRAFIVLCLLAWLDIAVDSVGEGVVGSGRASLAAHGTVVLALLAAVAALRDRGILSHVGLAQLVGVGAFAAVGHYVLSDFRRLADVAAQPELAFLSVEIWPGYAAITVAVAVLAAVTAAIGWYRYRGPVERSFGWSVVTLMVVVHPATTPGAATIFVMTTALIVTLGIVETSYVMAYRDELTGLPGRRALMQYLGGIQGLYTVAMVDVDHFKKFNDKHGHDVGDQVLKLVASRLGRAPGGGKAYRYGGEEFTLIFPGRTTEDALPHLEAVRHAVEESRFAMRSWRRPRTKPKPDAPKPKRASKPKHLSVTVSLGMADTAGGQSDPESVLKAADEALYRAKKRGRNQVSK